MSDFVFFMFLFFSVFVNFEMPKVVEICIENNCYWWDLHKAHAMRGVFKNKQTVIIDNHCKFIEYA